MANVIGRTQGYTRNGPKAGEATRLGSECVRSEANTWRTFCRAQVTRDGNVNIEVRRDGQPTLYLTVNSEDAPQLRYRFASSDGEIASTWNDDDDVIDESEPSNFTQRHRSGRRAGEP